VEEVDQKEMKKKGERGSSDVEEVMGKRPSKSKQPEWTQSIR